MINQMGEVCRLLTLVADQRREIAKLRAWLKWCLDNCDDSPEWDFGTYATDTIRTLLAGGDVPIPEGDDAALAKESK